MTINMSATQMSAGAGIDFSKLKASTANNQKKSEEAASANTKKPSGPPPDAEGMEGMEKPSGAPPVSGSMQQMQGASGSAQTGTSSSEELSDEEKRYDADGDGTLSIEEQAAYMQAKLNEKSLEAASNSTASDGSATVSISAAALKLQKEGKPNNRPQGLPNIGEMSDEDLKSMLSGMKEKNGQLPKELGDYNKADIENLSEDELNSIRDTMTQMQEKMAQRKSAMAEYGKKNTLGAVEPQ